MKKSLPRFRWQLVALTLARLFITTSMRIVYPFAPALARGLGVASIYPLISLRNFSGFLSPLFSPLSERYGRKPLLIFSAALFSAGSMLVVVWPTYWMLGAAMIITAVIKVIYDPAMQAHVGDTVPYQQRGKAIAVTELSWAGALLVGAPAVGLMMQRWGWRAPFFWLSVLAAISVFLLWRLLPGGKPAHSQINSLRDINGLLRRRPMIWAVVIFSGLISSANELLFIVYGDWMETSFTLSLASLGLASSVIGGAEITGEIFAGWSVDRFGKRRVVAITAVLNGILYLIVPFTGGNLILSLASLFLLFLFYEITYVGSLPLFTEIAADGRGVVMAMVLAASAVGRTAGSLLGPIVWQRGGLIANGALAAVAMITAVFVLVKWIREGE